MENDYSKGCHNFNLDVLDIIPSVNFLESHSVNI